jgi:uncharacterized membrane protein
MSEKYSIKKISDVGSIEELASMRHSQNINNVHEKNYSIGDKIADNVAEVAGSWKFIISFIGVLFLWITSNSIQLLFHPFDPFPFILLNLVLSCVAALQAPVIMMSQNRQEDKDRLRAEHDYEVNLKSEILIAEVLKRLIKLEENQRELIKQIGKKEE